MNESLRRDVALHALASLSTKPNNVENREKPWSFLIDTNDPLRQQFREWGGRGGGLHERLREAFDNYRNWKNEAPLVITAFSGGGKTMLMSQVVASLLEAHDDKNSKWPLFNVLFSQLKNNDHVEADLERAICSGIDPSRRALSLDALKRRIGEAEHPVCLIVDSLDEHPEKGQWWSVFEKVRELGWIMVIACRKTDFETIRKDCFRLQKDEDLFNRWYDTEWDVKSWSWDLLPSDEDSEAFNKCVENIPNTEERQHALDFLKTAYRTTPLLYVYETNFTLLESRRQQLKTLLLKNLLKAFQNSNAAADQDFTARTTLDSKFFITYYSIHPVKVLMESTIQFISSALADAGQDTSEIEEEWFNLCQFTESHNERIPMQGMRPNSDIRIILQNFGLLVSSNANWKWRHRDFMMHAHIAGKGGIDEFVQQCERSTTLTSLLDDDLYAHLDPSRRAPQQQIERQQRVIDFQRRTCQAISAMKDRIEDAVREERLDKQGMSLWGRLRKTLESIDDDYGMDENQVKNLRDQWGRTIVLRGFPGTGKTHSGVRRLLIRHAAKYASGTPVRSLIVALNTHLARNIRQELQKEEFKELHEFDDIEQGQIKRSIEVKSLKEIFEDWAPDLCGTRGEDWLLTPTHIEDLYVRWMRESNYQPSNYPYSDAITYVQQQMHDPRTGEIKTPCEESAQTEFHDVVKRKLDNGMKSEESIAAQLRDRLLRFEAINAGAHNVPPLESEVLEELRRAFANTNYDMILVDEVQDMNPLSVHLLSFLAPNRGPEADRFVLAGDGNQTINGRRFEWKRFLRSLTDHTRQIVKQSKEWGYHIGNVDTGEPGMHHLHGLWWDFSSTKDIPGTSLEVNYRSNPDIIEFAKDAWESWPTEKVAKKLGEDLAEGSPRDMKPGKPENDVSMPLLLLEADSEETYWAAVKDIIARIRTESNTTLLVASPGLHYAIKTLMDSTSNDNQDDLAVEFFNTWDIKGLERDNVILLGQYMVAEHDREFNALEFDNNGNIHQGADIERMKAEYNLFRRIHLVAQTRAKKRLICLTPPRSEQGWSSLIVDGKHSLRFKQERLPERYTTEPTTIGNVDQIRELWNAVMKGLDTELPHSKTLEALIEGMQVFLRFEGTDNANLAFFERRWHDLLKADQRTSNGRKSHLEHWLEGRLDVAETHTESPIYQAIYDTKYPSVFDVDELLGGSVHKNIYSNIIQSLFELEQNGLWNIDSWEVFHRLFGYIHSIETRCAILPPSQLATTAVSSTKENANDVLKEHDMEVVMKHFEDMRRNTSSMYDRLDGKLLQQLNVIKGWFSLDTASGVFTESDYFTMLIVGPRLFGGQYRELATLSDATLERMSAQLENGFRFSPLMNAINRRLDEIKYTHSRKGLAAEINFQGKYEGVSQASVASYFGQLRIDLDAFQPAENPGFYPLICTWAVNLFGPEKHPTVSEPNAEDGQILGVTRWHENFEKYSLESRNLGALLADLLASSTLIVENKVNLTKGELIEPILKELLYSEKVVKAFDAVLGKEEGVEEYHLETVITEAWAVYARKMGRSAIEGFITDPRASKLSMAQFNALITRLRYDFAQGGQSELLLKLMYNNPGFRDLLTPNWEGNVTNLPLLQIFRSNVRKFNDTPVESWRQRNRRFLQDLYRTTLETLQADLPNSWFKKLRGAERSDPNDHAQIRDFPIEPFLIDSLAVAASLENILQKEMSSDIGLHLDFLWTQNPYNDRPDDERMKSASLGTYRLRLAAAERIGDLCDEILSSEEGMEKSVEQFNQNTPLTVANGTVLRLYFACALLQRLELPDDVKNIEHLIRPEDSKEAVIRSLIDRYPALSLLGFLGKGDDIELISADVGWMRSKNKETASITVAFEQQFLNRALLRATRQPDTEHGLLDKYSTTAFYLGDIKHPRANGYDLEQINRLITPSAEADRKRVVLFNNILDPAHVYSRSVQFVEALLARLQPIQARTERTDIMTFFQEVILSIGLAKDPVFPEFAGMARGQKGELYLTSCWDARPLRFTVTGVNGATLTPDSWMASDIGDFMLRQLGLNKFLDPTRSFGDERFDTKQLETVLEATLKALKSADPSPQGELA